ncbi:hypothetical protein [Aphanothece sacrum]|uniref:Uncharacterized protein n=1 Tax=Aphanothece sacrum FPU1 TaxID=1920663 RepID=A0A401IBH5_APHSA|nr:hypothetical protein [Aphanothece sacrum]GBF78623.1 hypothetical protein AsFPU1_0012 [Aphanothece sacrum FPU1]GBF84866.1 hypothetical protein AsFPU3_1921 [Aphanothece sacrum FPU3]
MSSVTTTASENTAMATKNQDNSVGFWQEDNGNNSSMRLMSFIALISAITFGGITLFKPDIKEVGIQLTYSFLVAGFAPKAVQKFAETRIK